jgi:hypothetical protein
VRQPLYLHGLPRVARVAAKARHHKCLALWRVSTIVLHPHHVRFQAAVWHAGPACHTRRWPCVQHTLTTSGHTFDCVANTSIVWATSEALHAVNAHLITLQGMIRYDTRCGRTLVAFSEWLQSQTELPCQVYTLRHVSSKWTGTPPESCRTWVPSGSCPAVS